MDFHAHTGRVVNARRNMRSRGGPSSAPRGRPVSIRVGPARANVTKPRGRQSDGSSTGDGGNMKRRKYTKKQRLAAKRLQRFWRRFAAIRLIRLKNIAKRVQKQTTQRHLREICIYIIFLILFTTSSIVVVQDQRIFHLANGIKGQIAEAEFEPADAANVYKSLFDVQTAEDVWQWARGPLYLGLYTGASEANVEPRVYPGTIYGTNFIVGGVTVSQLRVRLKDCLDRHTLHGMRVGNADTKVQCRVDGLASEEPFSEAIEDTASFGSNGVTFTWAGNNEAQGYAHWTVNEERSKTWDRLTDWQTAYPSGAFRVILPNRNASKAQAVLAMMEKGHYIDLQTRLLTVEFNTFNPAMDYFCHVVVYIEQPASGSLLVSWQTDTLRLFNVLESLSIATAVLEVFVALFFLWYMAVEFMQCRKYGKKYLTSVGNIIHNLNLFVYLLTWVFRVLMLFSLPTASDVVMDSDVAYQFHAAVAYKALSLYATSVNAFLCWFKLVKFLSYVPRFALVTGTLRRSAVGVSGFSIVFLTVFYGFSAAFMLAHGGRVSSYRNMTQSGLSLLRSLLGDFDFLELQKAQWFMGPLLFLMFVGVAVFVVLNILIAIISDSYADEQKALGNSQDVQLGQEIKEYLLTTIEGLPIVGKWFHKGRKSTLKLVQKVHTGGIESIRAVRAHSAKAARFLTTTSSGNEGSDSDKGEAGDGDSESKPGVGAGGEVGVNGELATPVPRGSATSLVVDGTAQAGAQAAARDGSATQLRPPGSISPDMEAQDALASPGWSRPSSGTSRRGVAAVPRTASDQALKFTRVKP